MTEHSFRMRLSCRYEQPDNVVSGLEVQNLVDSEWQDFNMNFKQPGFLIFVYAILNCQHLYMRSNAAERGLLLDSAGGSIEVLADNGWVLQKLHVDFDVKLQSGNPSPQDVDYIIDRMRHCPVSANIKNVPDTQTRVEFTRIKAD
jgi:hypothetical protein